ncbi:ankyrin, partial [Lepidopterella palustris CBS 459.81]
KGAKPNARHGECRTALSWAAEGDNVEIVKLLLDKGAEPNLRDRGGWTVLSWATERRHGQMGNKWSDGALVGSEEGHVEIADLLLKKGAETNSIDAHGRTGLMWAVNRGHVDIVELLKKGAQSNAVSRWLSNC